MKAERESAVLQGNLVRCAEALRLAAFEASSLFQQVMVKYPPWQAGQAQTMVFTEPAR
jgi:hypothetical protein